MSDPASCIHVHSSGVQPTCDHLYSVMLLVVRRSRNSKDSSRVLTATVFSEEDKHCAKIPEIIDSICLLLGKMSGSYGAFERALNEESEITDFTLDFAIS